MSRPELACCAGDWLQDALLVLDKVVTQERVVLVGMVLHWIQHTAHTRAFLLAYADAHRAILTVRGNTSCVLL